MGLKINSIQIEQNFDFGNVSIGGKDNTITENSSYSTILAGCKNSIGTQSSQSIITGGKYNTLYKSYNSSISGGGCNNLFYYSNYSSIIGGFCNTLATFSQNSSIVGGRYNNLSDRSCYSSIIGGCSNNLSCKSYNSSILGGYKNNLSYYSCNSSIIGGQCNILGTQSCNSVILGGVGLELNSECSVVYVPSLKISTASNVSADRILVWDTDNYVKYREVSTISGGGGSVAINTDEVGFGTGTGLTSSGNFKFNTTCNNLIAASKGGEITNSENSVILGGECYSGTPYFGQSGGNQIIGGKNNLVTGGFYCNNGTIYNLPNKIYNSISSTILGGRGNTLGTSSNSSIIGGRCNTLSYYSFNSSIINGFCNTLSNSSSYSSIINGFCNTLSQLSNYSSIVGGYKNTLCCSSYKSSIIGGKSNTLTCFSYYSSIIGGQGNTISCNSCNSVILGGVGLTLSNECSIVLVPTLKIATASNVSASRILVWDDNNYVGYREDSTISGGGSAFLRNKTNSSSTDTITINQSIFNPSNLIIMTTSTFIIEQDAEYYVLGDLTNNGSMVVDGVLKVGGAIYNYGPITGSGIIE